MNNGTLAIESVLLSTSADLPASDGLRERLSALLSRHDLPLEGLERIAGAYVLASCGPVQVLFALTAEPLPMEGFSGALRPDAAALSDGEILERLTQINSTATVIVLPSSQAEAPNAEEMDLLEQLCWEITALLAGSMSVDLIFWAETETLYAAEEFEDAHGFTMPEVAPQPDPAVAPRFATEPELNAEALAWFEHGILPSHMQSPLTRFANAARSIARGRWREEAVN